MNNIWNFIYKNWLIYLVSICVFLDLTIKQDAPIWFELIGLEINILITTVVILFLDNDHKNRFLFV